ncbi:MAG: HAMP domain-containing histidine kinase [Clostridia bacterium]|nr:HAMP domain-containing histidine kinase [Clostridia bacterium]MDE7328221.1 HAMP domain-containing histidine kinase [Clostridia bacterium]
MRPKKTVKKDLFVKLSLASFVAILAASGIFSGAYYILENLHVKIDDVWWTLIIAAIAAVAIGVVLSSIVNIAFFTPMRNLCDVTKKVADGDFSAQLKEKTKKNGELKNDEISTLIHNFNTMVNELNKNKMLGSDFVANISHEFKTPLANIKGHAELIKNCNSQALLCEYCDNIIEAADSLTALTSNILRLSKLENHAILEPNEFRIDEQIRMAIIAQESKWSEKNLNINIDLDEVTIFYDEQLFYHVWLNLISNAIKFSSDGGDINILLKKYENEVVFVIKDNGVGMSQQTQERIFEKFYQGDMSRAKEGNGLGLALVKKILDNSHCSITVDSQEGKGSTFTVKIPV